MRTPVQWYSDLDRDWRVVVIGVMAAPALFLSGLVVGALAGGLLPGTCQGLACVYFGVLIVYSLILLAIWGVVAGVTGLARRRWPESTVRLRTLQVLAGASYLPLAWLVGMAVLDWA